MTRELGDPILITLDSRCRATIPIGRHSRYVVIEEPDGVLVFTPADEREAIR